MVILTGVSLYLILLSPASFKIDNTQTMARTVIKKVVNESDNPELKESYTVLRDSQIEDNLLKALPKKTEIHFSYADIYQLSVIYQKHGKLTAANLGLSSKNELQKLVNNFIISAINQKMKQEYHTVSNLISIYHYSVFAIILLYLLSAVLFLFKRYSASFPILLASIFSFAVIWYFCYEASSVLQTEIYRGINVYLNAGIWLGLIIAIAIAIVWPFVLTRIKGKENNA